MSILEDAAPVVGSHGGNTKRGTALASGFVYAVAAPVILAGIIQPTSGSESDVVEEEEGKRLALENIPCY